VQGHRRVDPGLALTKPRGNQKLTTDLLMILARYWIS
jgi:hypothetical protein